MTPALSTRETAAKLYEAAWKAEDVMVAAEDDGSIDAGRLHRLEQACLSAWQDYDDFVDAEGIELMTEASGAVLRCAETNIPLVIQDECVENSDGKLIRVKQAA